MYCGPMTDSAAMARDHWLVDRRSPASIAYVVLTAILWLVALPAMLVADAATGSFPGRHPLALGVAAGCALLGLGFVDRAASRLATAGVPLWSAAPGPQLVTDGIYAVVRNPIEIGTVLAAISPWIAVDVPLMWVVPAGAAVWLVAGIGPYEDRRLHETFGTEFDDYRGRVRKWLPRR
jgi:protein-S-isoprenylcysteine O-methyltransferase Ste14